MKTRALVLIFAALAPLPAAATPVAPAPVAFSLAPGAVLRAFANHGDISVFVEGLSLFEGGLRWQNQLTAGLYFQPISNLKVGAFYRRAYGLRHDEDWALDATSGQWAWADTRARGEDVAILDATPKVSLGANWVGELKLRYLYDAFNHESTLLARPGVTYFLLKDNRPLCSFFGQLELDYPLGYGVEPLDEVWAYVGALYHFNDAFALGAFTALHWQSWNAPAAYTAKGGAPYLASATDAVLALTAVFRADF